MDSSVLRSRVLCTLQIEATGGRDIANPTPPARLSIWTFAGGWFEGPRFRGEVLPVGGDWASVVSEDLAYIDVKGLLRTDDGELIALQYRGLWVAAPGLLQRISGVDGHELFKPEDNYLRVVATFQTASARYLWLNRLLAVGIGRPVRGGVRYEFHEVL